MLTLASPFAVAGGDLFFSVLLSTRFAKAFGNNRPTPPVRVACSQGGDDDESQIGGAHAVMINPLLPGEEQIVSVMQQAPEDVSVWRIRKTAIMFHGGEGGGGVPRWVRGRTVPLAVEPLGRCYAASWETDRDGLLTVVIMMVHVGVI